MKPRHVFAVGLRFYVASRLENLPAAKVLCDLLKAEGHVRTYDWTAHGRVWKPDAEDSVNQRACRDISVKELEGVTRADVVVVWLPGGRGTHCEIGMALAAQKPIILCNETPLIAEQGPCAFYFHPSVQHVVHTACRTRMDLAVKAVRDLTVAMRMGQTAEEDRCVWEAPLTITSDLLR